MKCPYCDKDMFSIIEEKDFEPILVWKCTCEHFIKSKVPKKETVKKKNTNIEVIKELTID